MQPLPPVEGRATDAVVLIPGFLGFSRIGRFYYYSERIAAAIRGALEARLGRSVVVVPCGTQPMDGLAVRQEFLLSELQIVCNCLPRLERLHLVGHSTGGVDAQLLTCERPLAEGADLWTKYAAVRAKLASVVAVASPHHGTFLARSLPARLLGGPLDLLRDPLGLLRGVGGFARLLAGVVPIALRHPAKGDLAPGLTQQLPETLRFLKRMWDHRELIRELAPERMAELRLRARPEGRVPLTSFVTVAGLSEAAPRRADSLFRDLHGLTAAHTAPAPACTPAAIARLRAHGRAVIGKASFDLASIEAGSSDGIVSSCLQLLDPADPHELGGIVVGDHGDVIGHYDRAPALLEEEPLNVGIFHSGSGFDDDAFFELCGLVVGAISRSIPELAQATELRRGIDAC